MAISQLSRRQFIVLAIQLLIATQLPSCRNRGSLLGKGPIDNPLVVEDHSEALAHWAEKGVRDAVLINIDTHDDLRWIPERKCEELAAIYRRRDWQHFRAVDTSAEGGLYHVGNWIHAGHRLGMFREVIWVIPFAVLSMNNPDEKMRRFLTDYEFEEKEIANFALHDGRFRGTVNGLPLTICDAGSLPDISDPLLLSIDTDFFPPHSIVHEQNYLHGMHDLFRALYARKYRVLDAVVAYSVNGDYLPPHLRWVGDTTAALLGNPRLIDDQPPQQILLTQELDTLHLNSDPAGILKLADTWKRAGNPDSAAIEAYRAIALVLQGDVESAFLATRESCRLDRRYCTLFPYIGTYWYSDGRYRDAERFFRAGFGADPGMANGLFQYAHCLRHLGRIREALTWYQRDEAKIGIFPSRFLIAETEILLGDHRAAKASIAKGVAGLTANRYAQVVNRETADAIYRVLSFCDSKGLSDASATLRSNRTVTAMFAAYPPKS